jgi:hypothetical protein
VYVVRLYFAFAVSVDFGYGSRKVFGLPLVTGLDPVAGLQIGVADVDYS